MCLLGGVGGDVVMLVVDDVLFAEMVKFETFRFGPFLSADRKKNNKTLE